jgi:hypothetical protein
VFKLPIELDLDLSLRMIIQEAISKMICKRLDLSDEFFLRAVEYLPTFKKDNHEEKELNNLYIRLVTQNNYKVITHKEILESGATWQEVIEFLLFSGSRRITTKEFFDTDNN